MTGFKRHALHAWVPDSRHVSLSRCDGVYLLTYLTCDGLSGSCESLLESDYEVDAYVESA